MDMLAKLDPTFQAVLNERLRQDEKFPLQDLPNGTDVAQRVTANVARAGCDFAATIGGLTWAHVLGEEFWEAIAEEDDEALYVELVQVAAVAIRWAQSIAARSKEHVNTIHDFRATPFGSQVGA